MEWREPQIVRALGHEAPDPASEAPDPLLCILHSTITTFRVEFLLVGRREKGVVKPHVVFQLIFEPYHRHQTAVACRLSMEYTADGSNGNGGSLNIKAVSFLESHIQATGSFGFPVTPMGKLAKFENWIRILLGQYNHQLYPGSIRGDMTQYDFVHVQGIPRANNEMDGCRDWIAQAFTRFYLAGFVAPFGQELADTPALFDGAEVTYLNFEEHIHRRPVSVQPAPFWFPDIIDKKFSPTPTANKPHGVTIEPLQMWRGRFYDDDVVRHEMLQIYHADGCPHFILRYNYRGQSRPGSAHGGSGGGPPPPGGPPGGSGPGGSGSGSSGFGGPAQCSSHGGDAGRRQPQDGRSGAPTSAQPGTSAGGGNTTNATGRHNTVARGGNRGGGGGSQTNITPTTSHGNNRVAGGGNRGGGGGSQTNITPTTSHGNNRVAGGGNRGGGGGSQTNITPTTSHRTNRVAGGGNRGGGGGSQTENTSTASVATSTVVKDGKRKRSP